MKDFWNQRYGESEYAYGTEPNVFFKSALDALPVGRLLLPAEGEGRNAVYAASRGWQVDAFDFSEAGRNKALALAEARGVTVNYSLTSYSEVSLSANSYDAVALIFAHVHETQRRGMHVRMMSALKPGGTLIMEAYSKDQLGRGTGGPPVIEMLYDADDLRQDVADLDVSLFESLDVAIHEGVYHSGLASVIRVVAGK